MSDELVPLNLMVRPEHKTLLEAVARAMGVSVSAVGRWMIDHDGNRAFLLTKACLQENDLPQEIRRVVA